jgi:hypothetical protein
MVSATFIRRSLGEGGHPRHRVILNVASGIRVGFPYIEAIANVCNNDNIIKDVDNFLPVCSMVLQREKFLEGLVH